MNHAIRPVVFCDDVNSERNRMVTRIHCWASQQWHGRVLYWG